jgi:hypothetical protein
MTSKLTNAAQNPRKDAPYVRSTISIQLGCVPIGY